MKISQVATFLAVAESKSIRGAARQLGVTQPGVTKAMRDLEADLGVPLLTRSVEGVQLTEYGELLFVRGKRLISEIRRIEESLLHMRDTKTGRVRIGTCATAAYRLLPKTLEEFRLQIPKVDLQISEGSLSHFRPALQDGSLDFVIANLPLGHSDDELVIDVLCKFANVIGVRSAFAPGSSATLAGLRKLPWIVPGPGVFAGGHELIAALFRSCKLDPPEQIIHCESLATALGLMSTTNLVGLFTEPLAKSEFGRFGLKVLKIREAIPSGQMAIVSIRDSEASLPARVLMDLLHANIGHLQNPVPALIRN